MSALQRHVIEDGGTEPPFRNKYYKNKEHGVYTCARCGAVLYHSDDKFDSGSGWPAFDRPKAKGFLSRVFKSSSKSEKSDSKAKSKKSKKDKNSSSSGNNNNNNSNVDAVDPSTNERQLSKDSSDRRTEIRCSKCGGHLGHAFFGEQFTETNRRDCVNSASMKFYGLAYFAGGCFWGVEHLLEALDGVRDVESG